MLPEEESLLWCQKVALSRIGYTFFSDHTITQMYIQPFSYEEFPLVFGVGSLRLGGSELVLLIMKREM